MASKRKRLTPRTARPDYSWVHGVVGALIAILGVLVIVVVTFLSAPRARAEPAQTKPEVIQRIERWLWPRWNAPVPLPVPRPETPAPVPPEVVEAIPPPPRIEPAPPPTADVTPSPEPAPKTIERVKPGPNPKPLPKPRVKRERERGPEREHNKPAQHRSISAADCARLRNAVATYGSGMVEMGARARGYSSAQIAFARRACGVR